MFEVGRVYNRRDELHGKYGRQQQGGISTPTDHPFIMLFTGESGEQYGYRDGPNDNGVFVYTGEGQKGDMEFARGNKGIRDHASDGKALQLFKSLGKGRGYEFVGEFVCSTFDYRRGPDVDGNDRRVIVFHLVGIDDQRDGGRNNEESTESIESLREQAYDAATPATEASERDAKHHVYERSDVVRRYVLKRANGTCESCGEAAPFRRGNGNSYLETHHTQRVSDGGPDDPRWVGAVCPNCHREIHHGENGKLKNEELKKRLSKVESRPRKEQTN